MFFLISWLQLPPIVIWEPKKRKSVTASSFSTSICHELMGSDAMIFAFLMSAFSLSSFTFIKRFFSFSSFSVIRMVSSAYLRSLIFLPAILIPSFDSSSLAFHMMQPSCNLNMQGNSLQPRCTVIPVWNQSVVPCLIMFLLDPHIGFLGDR